jgi:hypothetical protein
MPLCIFVAVNPCAISFDPLLDFSIFIDSDPSGFHTQFPFKYVLIAQVKDHMYLQSYVYIGPLRNKAIRPFQNKAI